jgi:branched-chain amino acid transport system permease protein
VLDYTVNVLTNLAIFATLTLGLDLQWGWGGMANLSYFTFVAIGAYMSAVVTMGPPSFVQHYVLGFSWPFGAGVAVGVASAGVLALVMGIVALKRLRQDYFVIVTLSAGVIISQVVTQTGSLFGGAAGIYGIPQPLANASWLSPSVYPQFFLAMCLACLLVTYLILRRLHDSSFGRALRAARDNEAAAQAFGHDVFRLKLKAFVIGGMVAGLGGALLGAYLTTFDPGAWALGETSVILVAVLLGGRGRPVGVLLGVAIVVGALQEGTQFLPSIASHPDFSAALRMLIIGILMIIMMRIRPQGLLPERPRRDRWSPPAETAPVKADGLGEQASRSAR